MAQICFDRSTFMTVVILGLSIITYVIITNYRDLVERQLILMSEANQQHTETETGTEPERAQLPPSIIASYAQRLEDMQRMNHPLAPPVRRGPFSGLPAGGSTVPILTPTRGEYGSFEQVGFLHNANDTDQAMPLIGRRLHSNQYEYYTFHHNNPQVKIPIKLTGNKEISDGDAITVTGYGTQLTAKIYDLDSPRYIPY